MNLETLSLDELKKLRKDVDKAIETYEARQLAEAREKLEAQARELGFSLEAIVGASKTGNTKRLPRYRHPENPTLTWTGMGRKPKWFIDAIEAGMTKDDLRI
ncbi:H-NS family nucleoid-associated regulatory protein [Roseovarius tibetensis]|uniref:H-NS histone family protein n=1 Tax=Roseovarius tibetensis TaxID=2685897 RepID=UPI003D7FCF2D